MSDIPSFDEWLAEAKASPEASQCGMYLCHNGVVREVAKEIARGLGDDDTPVTGMEFSYDEEMLSQAVERAKGYKGIHYVRVWLNSGHLGVGDDIMRVLVGGDIRDNTIDGLVKLVADIKQNIVVETEVRG